MSLTEERKLKLLSLGEENVEPSIGFNWGLAVENKEEEKDRIKNLHLFCLSIVKDLFANRFMTNENGIKKYKKYKKDDVTLKKLEQMFSIIASEKNKK